MICCHRSSRVVCRSDLDLLERLYGCTAGTCSPATGRQLNRRLRRVYVVAACAGAVLIALALAFSLHSRPSPKSPSTAAYTPTSAPVDLVDAASIALQDCARAVPPSIPDGTRATRAEMTAARSAFQAYDTATNTYIHCVDTAIEHIANQYATVASPSELKSLKAFGRGAHDTAIDQEQSVADQFNTQIRTYRARHPQS
jgi:hypothetical protein